MIFYDFLYCIYIYISYMYIMYICMYVCIYIFLMFFQKKVDDMHSKLPNNEHLVGTRYHQEAPGTIEPGASSSTGTANTLWVVRPKGIGTTAMRGIGISCSSSMARQAPRIGSLVAQFSKLKLNLAKISGRGDSKIFQVDVT